MIPSFLCRQLLLAVVLFLSVVATRPLPAMAGSGPDDGAMAPPTRLVIPRIKLDVPIEPVGLRASSDGFEWNIPWSTVGWHNLSSSPGHTGNTVLSGHNFSQGGRVFQKLWMLKPGDRFTVFVGETQYWYVVAETITFREVLVSDHERNRNKRWIGQFPDERVTLITCHPTWTNAGRLVVIGKPLRQP